MSKKSEAIDLLFQFKNRIGVEYTTKEQARKLIEDIIVKVIEIDDTQHAPVYIPYYIPPQPCPQPQPKPWWEGPYTTWCDTKDTTNTPITGTVYTPPTIQLFTNGR